MALLFKFVLTSNALPPDVVLWKSISAYTTITGALFLWLSLFFMGIIARKYEKVLKKNTNWLFVMLAPSGLLLYALIQAYSLIIAGNIKMTAQQTWISYGLFFLSGLFSMLGAFQFYKVVSPKKRKRDGGQ